MPEIYPGAIWRPSSISHPTRPKTLGIVIHWTVGHEAGDITVLDGPSVDVHFYVTKSGKVYQFLPFDSQAWHGYRTANTYSVGIETEGAGEAWTAPQLAATARLTAWLCKRYSIPVKHATPRNGDLASLSGIFGHGDLTKGRVDGNNHSDTVPAGTGWEKFLAAVRVNMARPATSAPPKKPTLRYRLIKGFLLAGFGSKSAVKAADKYLKEN